MRLAQLDRAFGYGPKGRGFESSNARYGERPETLKNQWFPAFFVFVDLSSNLLRIFKHLLGDSFYCLPEYEVLHTQSREYIVDNLLDVMKEKEVEV